MENGVKALTIAGSTLIAVILFAAVSYFFSNISNVPTQQDELQTTEQLSKFNLEYEIYQKSAMYGVDVVSCFNKAISNNEKYVEGNGFLSGNTYGKEYLIDVCVTINSELEEYIEVKAMNTYNKEFSVYNDTRTTFNDTDLKDMGFNVKGLTSFKTDTWLDYSLFNTCTKISKNKEYSLINGNETDKVNLKKLFECIPKQEVKNTGNDVFYVDLDGNGQVDQSECGWSSATWYSYLDDFKKRRFKCTQMEYSEETGRINKIVFKEID